MSSSTSAGKLSVGGVLLWLLAGALALLVAGCTWIAVDADAIQGTYVAHIGSGAADSSWTSARIVLHDGAGTLTTSARAQDLTYILSDQSSPWIVVLLDDGTSMQLQYRRPGALTYYDPFGNRVDFARIGR